MNKYGHQARQHWERARPNELATLEDPDRYFTELGERVAAEIDRRAAAEETELTEDYLANVGMINQARFTAESEVVRELIYHGEPGS